VSAERLFLDPGIERCKRLRRTVTAAAANLADEVDFLTQVRGQKPFRKTFITLTYARTGAWKRHHISDFVRLMRRWFVARGAECRYVWVGETQKRGALHYHMLVFVPRSLRLPCPDTCGWWPHGMSKIETARNPVGYMVKYVSKVTPKDLNRLPKGVRLHGSGGHVPDRRVVMREGLMPRWVRDAVMDRRCEQIAAEIEAQERHEAVLSGETDAIDYETDEAFYEQLCAEAQLIERMGSAKPGTPNRLRCNGGFVDMWTGELMPTPWRVGFENGQLYVERKEEVIP
jgi:hypothetical protein